jgi:predicted Zn-dependent protease
MPEASKRLQMLEKMIAGGSRDPFVRYARALELRGQGELETALGALEEVRALHPDYVPTFLMAGQIAGELERTDDARAWLTAGVQVAAAAGDEHARSELQSALDGLG